MDVGEHRFLAQRAVWELHKLWEDNEWTREKLYNLFVSYYPCPEEVGAAIEALDSHLKKGKSLNDEEFRLAIMKKTAICFNQTLTMLDPITRVAAMSPYPPAVAAGLDFAELSPRFYLKPFEGAGRFGYISGPRGVALGVGKTDVSLLFAEMLLSMGHCVATNIYVGDRIKNLSETMTLKNMMLTCIKNLLDGRLTTVILDGVPQFMEKERATSKEYVNTKKVLYLLRKIGANLMVIAQREKEIPTAISDMASLYIQKKRKDLMQYRRFSEIYTIKNVPPTSIRFETGDFETFIIDLDVDLLHDHIACLSREEREGQGQLQAILDHLQRSATAITSAEKKTTAKVLYIQGRGFFTLKEIADLVGVQIMQVSRWLAEMGLTVDENGVARRGKPKRRKEMLDTNFIKNDED